ncbi:hypothetical protein [Desulforamulus aquiferis]|uniref:Uncharacterized protein n=1 Tax=Desulforamulus aquiferis TaxID=1397668 RepID=A0AAW7ZCI9_9FIRM|nr:hypothetical protein [Desulforamulus aquiferis]MDO7787003.1 hypothetical protein [Desulforamulus aquiferis]
MKPDKSRLLFSYFMGSFDVFGGVGKQFASRKSPVQNGKIASQRFSNCLLTPTPTGLGLEHTPCLGDKNTFNDAFDKPVE